MLRARPLMLAIVLFATTTVSTFAEDPRDIVKAAVQTELNANRNDHSHWLFFEVDLQPAKAVKQWVAQAQTASLSRVVERDGEPLPESQQRQEMSAFMNDQHAQNKQRRSGQHDDQQAAELLQMLPDAFIWSVSGGQGNDIQLHFRPNPQFQPPDLEARVFAAMEGEMVVDRNQHRIVTLKGHLIHDIKIAYGLLGELDAGGTFDVERRELSSTVWEITETHVHIHGHALIFKNISEEEDDVKSHFQQIANSTTLPQAEAELLHESPNPAKEQASGRH